MASVGIARCRKDALAQVSERQSCRISLRRREADIHASPVPVSLWGDLRTMLEVGMENGCVGPNGTSHPTNDGAENSIRLHNDSRGTKGKRNPIRALQARVELQIQR
jgi:hypothetical protein